MIGKRSNVSCFRVSDLKRPYDEAFDQSRNMAEVGTGTFYFKLFLSCFTQTSLNRSCILRGNYDKSIGDAINRIIGEWQDVTVDQIRSCTSANANESSITLADTPVQILRDFNSKYIFVELRKTGTDQSSTFNQISNDMHSDKTCLQFPTAKGSTSTVLQPQMV